MRKIPLGIAVALVLGSPNVFAVGQTYEGASKVGNHTDSEYSNFLNIQNAVNKNGEILDQVSNKTTQIETKQQEISGKLENVETTVKQQTIDINAANTNASDALKIANAAKGEVEGATTAAEKAQGVAEKAQSAAEIADGKAKTAQEIASSANIIANQNKSDISVLDGKVSTNTSRITNLEGSVGKGAVAYDMAVENKDAIKQEVKDRIEGQKETLAASKAYTDSKYGELSAAIEKNRKESFAGIAAALAASQVPQVTQGSYFSLGAGAGSYQGQTAIAVGMSARFSDNLVSKLTVTADTQQRTGLGAGFAVEW